MISPFDGSVKKALSRRSWWLFSLLPQARVGKRSLTMRTPGDVLHLKSFSRSFSASRRSDPSTTSSSTVSFRLVLVQLTYLIAFIAVFDIQTRRIGMLRALTMLPSPPKDKQLELSHSSCCCQPEAGASSSRIVVVPFWRPDAPSCHDTGKTFDSSGDQGSEAGRGGLQTKRMLSRAQRTRTASGHLRLA